jgi:nicotinate-nucleotide--dimethylbenzimidazole phosphoribosyltransferase
MPPRMTQSPSEPPAARPFDDIRSLIAQPPAKPPAHARTSPAAAADLGDLAAAADWIAASRGTARVMRPILALYAGAHAGGDVAETRAVLETVAAGEAAISRGAASLGAGLDVYDLALDRPLPDPAAGPVMSERECAATMAFGMEVLAKQPDLLILVGVGPGADAAARRLLAALKTGDDPLESLRRLGGRETAAIAGAIVGARGQGIPVLLEGWPALAAGATIAAIDPEAVAHCRTAEPAGTEAGGLLPLFQTGITRGDGTAALAALSMVKLACAMLDGAA